MLKEREGLSAVGETNRIHSRENFHLIVFLLVARLAGDNAVEREYSSAMGLA